ncbi:hypothetical protein AB4212_47245, partial [Streptomyces sp. 2MCAF27]
DAPATPVRTEIQDPAADDRTADGESESRPRPGQDTVVRTVVQRVQADDGRWVRNLTLDLPVRFGDGFPADRLQQFQERMRGLLDSQVNHGLPLPRSGDQLHIDLNLVHAPENPEAIEVTATDTPAPSDQFHLRMHSDDPSAGPAEHGRRKARNDATALRQVLRYTGLTDRSGDGASLFRRIEDGTLPGGDSTAGPAVPLDYLRSIEDVTDSGPVAPERDDESAMAPPSPVTTTSSDAAASPTTGSKSVVTEPVARPVVESEEPVRSEAPAPAGPLSVRRVINAGSDPGDLSDESLDEPDSGPQGPSAPLGTAPVARPRAGLRTGLA